MSEGMVYGQSMIAVGLRRGDRDAHCGRRSISHQILLMSVELWVGGAGKSLVSRGTGSSKLEEEEEGAGVARDRGCYVPNRRSATEFHMGKNKSITSRDVEFILVHVCLHVCF